MIFRGRRIEIRLQHTGERSNTPMRTVRFKRLSATRRAGAQAYATKPPRVRTRTPVRRTTPSPCCNHQSMMFGKTTCRDRPSGWLSGVSSPGIESAAILGKGELHLS